MSNCDCQKNTKKLIGHGMLITAVAAMAAGIFFGLRVTSTSFVYLLSLPVFRSDDKKPYTING